MKQVFLFWGLVLAGRGEATGDSQLQAAIVEALQEHFALAARVEEVEILEVQRFAPAGALGGERAHYELGRGGVRQVPGEGIYVWAGMEIDETRGRSIPVRARFRLPRLGEELRLKAAMDARQILVPELVELVRVYWKPNEAGRIAAFSWVVGKESRRRLAKGQRLLRNDFEAAPAVRRGERLVATERIRGGVLRYMAECLDAGAVGEAVRIRRPANWPGSKRWATAKVAAPGAVEILEGRP